MAGKFVLVRARNGGYRFNLLSSNGRVIASSEVYSTRAAALNGINSIRSTAPAAALDDQTAGATRTAARSAAAKKTAAKKTAAKKTGAKKTPAKKAPTTKAAAKKTAATRPPAKRAKKTSTSKAPAKSAAAKAADVVTNAVQTVTEKVSDVVEDLGRS